MATLAQRIIDLATRVSTECKSLRTLLNGNAADLSSLTTTNKTNLVAALNELKGLIDGAGAGSEINDAASSASSTWSSTKISAEIATAISALVNGSPTLLDTLNELAAALGDDPDFANNVATSLSNRVRFDAAQTLTEPQKTTARDNIGAMSASAIGDPDTNFVATFNSGLV